MKRLSKWGEFFTKSQHSKSPLNKPLTNILLEQLSSAVGVDL